MSGFVLVSALQRGPGQVSSLKNKLSRAILVVFLDVYTYEFGVLLSFIVTGVKTSNFYYSPPYLGLSSPLCCVACIVLSSG